MARTKPTKSAAPVPTVGSVLGSWVRATRTQLGMSQRQLADAASLSRSYVCDIERGRGLEPSLATLDALARSLDLTLTAFIAEVDEQSRAGTP